MTATGRLDLFVGEFADYSGNRICGVNESYGGAEKGAIQGQSFYCVPSVLKPMPSHLYHNLGGGKFADVSRDHGDFHTCRKGLGSGGG